MTCRKTKTRRRTQAIAKHFAFHANAIKPIKQIEKIVFLIYCIRTAGAEVHVLKRAQSRSVNQSKKYFTDVVSDFFARKLK